MAKYSFNLDIQSKLHGFKDYLQTLGNGEDTIRQKQNYTGYFLNWLELEHLQEEQTRYNDLLNFIDYCKLEGKSNSRTLELKPFQILELYEYINEVKPKIINEIGKPKPSRKPNKINKERLKEQLFISINGSENIKNSLLHLFKEIRKTIRNLKMRNRSGQA